MRARRLALALLGACAGLAGLSGIASAQGAPPGSVSGCIPGMVCPASGRLLNVSVAIPSITANGLAQVQVSMPGLLPGDNVVPGMAAGSVAKLATVTAASVDCTTAGTGIVTFVNEAGGLTAASTATTVTMNFTVYH